MAWTRNRQQAIEVGDALGPIGGFVRSTSDSDQTHVGPIYSPNGTAHWIVVNDAGALSTTTTDPNPI